MPAGATLHLGAGDPATVGAGGQKVPILVAVKDGAPPIVVLADPRAPIKKLKEAIAAAPGGVPAAEQDLIFKAGGQLANGTDRDINPDA